MLEDASILAILLGLVYVISALATFRHLLRVGRADWNRRLLQVAASLLWPVYWMVILGIASRFRLITTRAQPLRDVLKALLLAVALRSVAFLGGVITILFCAIGAFVALIIAVFTPARRLTAFKDYWLGPIPPSEEVSDSYGVDQSAKAPHFPLAASSPTEMGALAPGRHL